MPTTDLELRTTLERALAERLGAQRYGLWFQDRTRMTLDEQGLCIGVANRICLEYLEAKFLADVQAVAQEIAGTAVAVRFVIEPELFQAARRAQAEVAESPTPQTRAKPAPKKPVKKTQRKRRWRKLSDFIVGPCNRVAHASAQAIVEAPGLEVNPLVIHGTVGTGKTHLLEGVYVGIRRNHPDWRVVYATAEDFTNRFLYAMRTNRLASFRKFYRQCDALLVDDLHFLAGKKATQEEFIHTFDVLEVEGLQVAIACDCHPRLNDDLMPELVDRLLGGAIWGVAPPDYDTRLQLLQAKSIQRGRSAVPDDVLELLADQLRGNVRELEGAINGLLHFARVVDRHVDLSMARDVLGDLLRHSVRVIHLTDVDRAVCEALHLPSGTLQKKERRWAFSHPRMIAMYLARKHTSSAHTEIGRHFGNRSHSSVVAAEKKVRQWLEADHALNLTQQPMRVRDIVERVELALLR